MTNGFGGLSRQALEWVESKWPGAALEEAIPLEGGTSSLLYEIRASKDGERQSVVLRLHHKGEWLDQEPDLAKHEAMSLELAEKASIPAPRILAFDESGEACGMPAVLMTKVPGAVILPPAYDSAWLDGLAETLAEIHRHKAEGFPYEYFAYNDARRLERPKWSRVEGDWMRAFYIVAAGGPLVEYCLIHRDYHPGNILWENGRVSSVVDWVNTCRGPAGVDVGHCRVNLAQLYGTRIANEFLDAYERHAGESFVYDPYWDLLSLIDILDGKPAVYPGWKTFGMTGLSDELVRYRLDEYLMSLMDRFDDF
ncbi:aminoglycoside phosphotransferase family protein [Planococcus sp. A6]|uniref:phosphotransferase family protein n=1 Tax=Planococcus sp. A6 TaxID=2992760 RepID=UPI00237C2590|nr:aminoglycoside phosphotransferase family protein [Planococcus sp. A6]MDE0584637.1 aminoglycoside phosphotransferase family protein [Planococcus sp. A6]